MEKMQNDQRKEKVPMRTELRSGEENLYDSGRERPLIRKFPPPTHRCSRALHGRPGKHLLHRHRAHSGGFGSKGGIPVSIELALAESPDRGST